MTRTGKCLCGAVKFEIAPLSLEYGTCHCKMCQRWAGSALLGLTVPADTITFSGLEHVKTRQTSDWAERGWCNECGSGIWYRVTTPGPENGTYHMPIGLLDNTSGLTMIREIFTDEKAETVEFSGNRHTMTGAEVFAMYGADND